MANTASTASKTRTPAKKAASGTSTTETPQSAAPTKPATHAGDRDFWGQYVADGYELTSWLRSHYALVKKSKGSTAEGSPWYTVTDFGTRKDAAKGSEAEQNGRDRTKWCEQSAKMEADAPKAPAKKAAPAKKQAASAA